MKMLILSGIILLSATVSQAAGRPDSGKQDAFDRICKTMTFTDDRTKCVNEMSKHEHFDEKAVTVCAGMTFADDKIECVGAIGGKEYQAYEITNCASSMFTDDKLSCLNSSGSEKPSYGQNYGCVSKRQLLRELDRTDLVLSNGDVGRARQIISRLMNDVQCNR